MPAASSFSTPLFGKALREHRKQQENGVPVKSWPYTVEPPPMSRKTPAKTAQKFPTPKFGSFRSEQRPTPPQQPVCTRPTPPPPIPQMPQLAEPMYPTYYPPVSYDYANYQRCFQPPQPTYNPQTKMYLENVPIPSNLKIQPNASYATSAPSTRTLRKNRSKRSGGADPSVNHTIGEMRIVNVVATCKLHIKLNHKSLKEIFGESASQNKKFSAGTKVRLNDLQVTVTLFTSGSMVCTGAKSVTGAKEAMKRIIEELSEKGHKAAWNESAFAVSNVIGTVNLGYRVDCCKFAKDFSKEYTPELFNAVCYSIKEPKVTAKIFDSGKINFLGGKSVEQIHEAYELTAPKFLTCKK